MNKLLIILLITSSCLAVRPISIFNSQPSTVLDKSGNGNDGINHGAVMTPHNGMAFDDCYITANSPIIPATDFTLTAWINPTNYVIAGTHQYIIGQYAAAQPGRLLWNIQDTTGKLRLFLNDSYYSTTTPSPGWNHVAVKRSGSTITFYLNGLPDGTASESVTVYQGGNTTIAGLVSFIYNRFIGNIGCIRVYNKALTNEQLAKLYNQEIISTNGLVAFYDFEPDSKPVTINGHALGGE